MNSDATDICMKAILSSFLSLLRGFSVVIGC
jgi:hypothetical protein